jgi:hypothetical protein
MERLAAAFWSASTLIREALQWDKEGMERQLSNCSDEAHGGAYDRTQFVDQRAKMMQERAN